MARGRCSHKHQYTRAVENTEMATITKVVICSDCGRWGTGAL